MGYTHFDKVCAKVFAVGDKGSEKVITETYPGKQFYVDSVHGSATGDGLTWETALSTIDAAIGKCTANHGDVIWVAPKHTETITGTDITVDIAGVSVIGLGKGGLMPQIKHNNANAEVSISATDVTWQGIRHSADVTGVKVAIEIENAANYCTVRGCVFDVVTTTTDEFLVSVRTNDATNFAVIEDNDFDMGIGGAVAAISFTKGTDGTKVLNNRVRGDYSTACVEGITTLSTDVLIKGNILVNGDSTDLNAKPAIQLLTNSTGIICDNYCVSDVATLTLAIVADKCIKFQNFNVDAANETGGLVGTASTDG